MQVVEDTNVSRCCHSFATGRIFSRSSRYGSSFSDHSLGIKFFKCLRLLSFFHRHHPSFTDNEQSKSTQLWVQLSAFGLITILFSLDFFRTYSVCWYMPRCAFLVLRCIWDLPFSTPFSYCSLSIAPSFRSCFCSNIRHDHCPKICFFFASNSS